MERNHLSHDGPSHLQICSFVYGRGLNGSGSGQLPPVGGWALRRTRRTRAEEIAKQAALNAELLGAMNSHGNAVVSKNHVAVVTQDGKPGCWLTLLRDYSGAWSVLSASGAIDAVIPTVSRQALRDTARRAVLSVNSWLRRRAARADIVTAARSTLAVW